MDTTVHILYIEDRDEHILQARLLFHRITAFPIKFYSARTIITGEQIARSLLAPNQQLRVVILSDLHLPFDAYEDGVDGTYLLNLLADEIRAQTLAQALLIGISADLTPERSVFGSHATAELWQKPLSMQHVNDLQRLIAHGPPWVMPLAPHLQSQHYRVRDVMAIASRLWLRLRPEAARTTGKAILGILTRAITLSPEEYREGVLMVNQHGGPEAVRWFLRRHPHNAQLAPHERLFFIALLDGASQGVALRRATLTRRTSKPVLLKLYEHISTLVLTKK
jgi:hypothetical protein